MSSEGGCTKRKADVLGRRQTSSTLGRGSLAGWVQCPLCPGSKKQFARGRGIAAHLHAVHTPWKPPSKAELKRRKRQRERMERERSNTGSSKPTIANTMSPDVAPSWEPTEEEVCEWEQRVLSICESLEESLATAVDSKRQCVDRNGKAAKTYRDSLPPLLQAAADGDIETVKKLIQMDPSIATSVHDRNGSIAEHWAAGGSSGGHLECLKLLVSHRPITCDVVNQEAIKKRRRGGKTSLHYAARNGRIDSIQFLMNDANQSVDHKSGDGTTPLQLACYGGHLEAVKLLVETYNASLHLSNDWNCNVAHWTALHKTSEEDSDSNIAELCDYLYARKVDFTVRQKQLHSPLHKAAQARNEAVVRWMDSALSHKEKQAASQPDQGGHRPSDIYLSGGGSKEFGQFILERFEK